MVALVFAITRSADVGFRNVSTFVTLGLAALLLFAFVRSQAAKSKPVTAAQPVPGSEPQRRLRQHAASGHRADGGLLRHHAVPAASAALQPPPHEPAPGVPEYLADRLPPDLVLPGQGGHALTGLVAPSDGS